MNVGKSPGPGQQEFVVLVHGLWTGGWVMALQARRLQRAGFGAVTYSYDSQGPGLAEAAAGLARFAAALPGTPIHFVGHSLGGLVILAMLAHAPGERIGRVVLLGVPYADSIVVRRLAASSWGRRLLGRPLREWQEGQRPRPGGWELGVLAGRRSIGIGRLVARLPAPNDGVVSEAETRIPGMRDFVSLRVSHTEMLWSRQVTRQLRAFLGAGRFLAP